METISLQTKAPLAVKEVFSGREKIENFAPSSILQLGNDFWVTDELNHRIYRFQEGFLSHNVFGEYGKKEGQFWYPTALASDPEGRIYVADRWNHRIQIFDQRFRFLDSIGIYGDTIGTLNEPMGVAVYNDLIYVAERSGGKIQAFNRKKDIVFYYQNNAPTGNFFETQTFRKNEHYQKWLKGCSRFNTMETQFYQNGFQVGMIEYPQGLTFTSSGELFVVDKVNGEVVRFSHELEFLSRFHLKDQAKESFSASSCFFDSEHHAVWFGCDLGPQKNASLLYEKKGKHRNIYQLDQVRIGSFTANHFRLTIADFWSGKIYELDLNP